MNFSDETEMPVTYFGEFQGEGLSDLLMQFDFSDINKTDDVSEAYLYLYAKLDEDYANKKELVISREGTEWDASTVTMANITEYTFNFNGIPGKDTWRKPGNAESEYILQSPRFRNHCNAAAEYAYTGDEKYAYTLLLLYLKSLSCRNRRAFVEKADALSCFGRRIFFRNVRIINDIQKQKCVRICRRICQQIC